MSDDVELVISDEENAYYMREVKKTLAEGFVRMSSQEVKASLQAHITKRKLEFFNEQKLNHEKMAS